MVTMSTYIITGRAKAKESLETSFGTWPAGFELPVFRVEAYSTAEAIALAKEIIDPLETTEVHATAVAEVPTDPSDALARLNAELNALVTGAVMTPYEHYCESERLLTAGNYTLAQVLATLATASIPEGNGR
jgi:hypothetical protein